MERGNIPSFKWYFYVSFNYRWPKLVGQKDSDRYLVLFKQQHWLQSTATPHSRHSFPWDRQHGQRAQHLGNAAERGQFWNHIQTPVPLFLSSPTRHTPKVKTPSNPSTKTIHQKRDWRRIREHKAVRGHTKNRSASLKNVLLFSFSGKWLFFLHTHTKLLLVLGCYGFINFNRYF